MAHAAEWGHWYQRDGSPCYEVPYADPSKGMRPVTLADARKLKLVPSVTTIGKEANRPALNRWQQEKVLLAALTLPRKNGEPESEWIKRVFEDSQEQARKAAEKGTAIHAAIQNYFEDKRPAHEWYDNIPSIVVEYWEYVHGATLVLDPHFGLRHDWIAEKSFAHFLGFGGKIDLHCPIAVVDFKTTDKPLDGLKTWTEHHMQLAAYREGLKLPTAQCAICYVSTTKPGLSRIIEVPEEDLQKGWLMFKALLDYWYARTGLARPTNA